MMIVNEDDDRFFVEASTIPGRGWVSLPGFRSMRETDSMWSVC